MFSSSYVPDVSEVNRKSCVSFLPRFCFIPRIGELIFWRLWLDTLTSEHAKKVNNWQSSGRCRSPLVNTKSLYLKCQSIWRSSANWGHLEQLKVILQADNCTFLRILTSGTPGRLQLAIYISWSRIWTRAYRETKVLRTETRTWDSRLQDSVYDHLFTLPNWI